MIVWNRVARLIEVNEILTAIISVRLVFELFFFSCFGPVEIAVFPFLAGTASATAGNCDKNQCTNQNPPSGLSHRRPHLN
jgi:hypothetical protein